MKSPSLGNLLARGRTADVYEWRPGYVVKLFNPSMAHAAIETEADIARAMYEARLPVPAVGEIVQIDSRTGLIYERRDGASMLELLQRKPWRVFSFAKRLANLHIELHAASSPAKLRAQRRYLESKIRNAAVPAPLRTRAVEALASMRDDDRVCHGDFHPGNILIDGRKAVIIDWMNATRGNPLADVARTTILVLGAGQTDPSLSTHANAFVRLFHQLYLRYCFRSRRDAREEYRAWLPIAAAARLGEDVLAEEEKWLVAQAQGCKPLSTRSP